MGEHDVKDRFRGCLMGMAVGDALGTTVEFSPPGSFEPVTDMVGGGPFRLKPGQWTDDTSMGLCLAESLLAKGVDPEDQMQRYVKWWKEGYLSSTGRCFDIGNTIRDALSRFTRTGDPYSGSTLENAAGNGSIMRLAPVPMYYSGAPEEAITNSAQSSRTTHGAGQAVDACRYMAGIIIGALGGANKEMLLSQRYCPVSGLFDTEPLHHNIDEIACGSFKKRNPPEIKGTGYVVKSLEAALWAFYTTDDFKDGVLKAVNLGDDADTTAAIFGQIAGAHYGMSGIPPEWVDRITMKEQIVEMADRLMDA